MNKAIAKQDVEMRKDPSRSMSSGRQPERNRPVMKDATRRGVFDIGLAGVAVLLVALGLLFVLSSSSYTAGIKGDSLSEFRSQLIWAGVGLAGMITTMLIDYRVMRNTKFLNTVVIATLVLLLMVLILPRTSGPLRSPKINGAQRWIRLMAGDVTLLSIQPSEIAKFAVILYLSVRLSNRPKDIPYFTKSIVPCMAVAGVFFALVLMQPNMSTGGTIMIVALILLFAAGVKLKHLTIPLAALMPVAAILVAIEPYRAKRFFSFLDPWSMTGGDAYQLIQSYYAMANGGLFGTGFGMSRQKYSFLPYASSDFIFAIVSEEVGFIGSVLILGLFLLLVYFGLRVAMNCPDRFGTLLATGLTSMVAIQVIINVAVVTGSFPTTGLPLPFFTAGGTSLAIFMTEIGMLLSISRHKRATSAG